MPDGDDFDPATCGLDGLASNDVFLLPVTALDQHVRLKSLNQVKRGRTVKDDQIVVQFAHGFAPLPCRFHRADLNGMNWRDDNHKTKRKHPKRAGRNRRIGIRRKQLSLR